MGVNLHRSLFNELQFDAVYELHADRHSDKSNILMEHVNIVRFVVPFVKLLTIPIA